MTRATIEVHHVLSEDFQFQSLNLPQRLIWGTIKLPPDENSQAWNNRWYKTRIMRKYMVYFPRFFVKKSRHSENISDEK